MASQMRELSLRDVLTGLHNRRHFDEQCAQFFASAQRYQRPFSVMLCDIDHFKTVNDRFSHATGDEVLKHIARQVQSALRPGDVLGRMAGDELAVVARNLRHADGAAVGGALGHEQDLLEADQRQQAEQDRDDVEHDGQDGVPGRACKVGPRNPALTAMA